MKKIFPLKPYIANCLRDKKLNIFVSSLPRALITAQTLFSNNCNIIGDERFIEFELKFITIPFIKLKFTTWTLISRILWFLGIIKTTRSFTEERKRAINVANFLYAESQKNNTVLIAHGMLNLFVEKYLKTYGYKRLNKLQSGFFYDNYSSKRVKY